MLNNKYKINIITIIFNLIKLLYIYYYNKIKNKEE